MKKDKIILFIIGILIGSILTTGVFIGIKAVSKNNMPNVGRGGQGKMQDFQNGMPSGGPQMNGNNVNMPMINGTGNSI